MIKNNIEVDVKVESLAERTGWCGRMGDFEKDAT